MTVHFRINLLFFAAAFFAVAVGAAASAEGPKVVLILADYLSLDDYLVYPQPNVKELVSNSGVALLSDAPGGGADTSSTYVTVSAGAFCRGNSRVDQAFSSFEKIGAGLGSAEKAFQLQTGGDRNPAVVHLAIAEFLRSNEKRFAVSLPGALAYTLKAAGKRVAVFGNSDFADRSRRRAVIIAADEEGAVDFGDVSRGMLRADALSPAGFVTDAGRLAFEVDQALTRVDFVVADFGDISRVELLRRNLSPTAYNAHRKNAIANLDLFLSEMMRGRAGSATIILASMAAQLPEARNANLSPGIVAVRRANAVGGTGASATTRTPGFVTSVDIAPTVLAALDVSKPASMIGSPIAVSKHGLRNVEMLNRLVALNRSAIVPVLGLLAAIGIGAITAACIMIAFGKTEGRGAGWVRIVLILVASSPLGLLFATCGDPSMAAYIARLVFWMILLTAASFVLAGAIRKRLGDRVEQAPDALAFVVLAVVTCVALFIDAFAGGHLSRVSLFGAGQFRGYRFYGVGNEYMGVWIAMAAFSIVWIRECFPQWKSSRAGRMILFAACIAMAAALGAPQFGANAGGAISAVVAFGLIYSSGIKKSFRLRDVGALAAAGAALVVLIGIIEMLTNRGATSHIGLAALMVDNGGWSYPLAVATRKIAMNLRLLETPQAQYALLGGLPFFFIWVFGIGDKMSEIFRGRPAFRWGVNSALVAAPVAFIFNDSGAVSAALIVGFVLAGLLYAMLGSSKRVEEAAL